MNERLKIMVESQIEARGIKDNRVLSVMESIDRADFVPEKYKQHAYEDRPIPIGYGQTISQPYIVALMTELADLQGNEKVLEIGSGSGYQTAILSQLAAQVFTIERISSLSNSIFTYDNVSFGHGDGYLGWVEESPFDVILITAAPSKIPENLYDQLSNGGRLIAPEGNDIQQLIKVVKTDNIFKREIITYVRFVPMIGGIE